MCHILIILLLDLLSKKHSHPVVESKEFIDEFPPKSAFDPYEILRDPSGDLEIEPSLISTSDSCLECIFKLLGFIHECEMSISVFFGHKTHHIYWGIEPGILFEYFLLLVQRYFELIAAEEDEDDVQDLFNLSDDDGEKFEEKKKIAQVLLSLLNLASTDFRQNPHILPKIHALIDLFIRQFPDAMYLVVLADFSERGFESLYLDEERSFTGMCSCMNHESFRNERIFQNLDAFKHFQVLSCFTTARLCSTFACLLKDYCEPYYNETECKKAIVNACTFLMRTLPNEAAFEAINQIFTELEKPAEMVAFLLEAILAIESENLRGIIESPEFPIHPVESLKRLAENLTDALTRKYDFLCDRLKRLCPKKELVAALTAISEKSFVAGLIIERIFYKSLFDSKRNLEDVFDESVCGRMRSFMDYEKMSPEKSKDQQTNYLWMLSFLERKFSSFLTMRVSTCLVHLERERQQLHDEKQNEYRENVAGPIWDTKDSEDPITLKNLKAKGLFPKYRELCSSLEKVESSIKMLESHKPIQCLGDIEAKNTKEMDGMRLEKEKMRLEHTRLLQEVKKSILERLFCAQTSQEVDS